MEREIIFMPAFDKRSDDPKKNCGIHGVNLCFYLKDGNKAVQFIIYTNWHLPHVQDELDKKYVVSPYTHLSCHPQPADLGYHSPVPLWEGQKSIHDDCQLTGGVCYYDGSGLNAQVVYEILVSEGSEAVWEYLEKYFKEIFEEEK